jgi:hypothetical protein
MVIRHYEVIIYILFWAVRANGCVRRWRQPLLRGPEWFFNVRVAADFYAGVGRKLLRDYRARMFIPFAVDIPAAIAIFVSGRLVLINLLVIVLAAVIHINHSYSVDLAERRARAFEAPAKEPAVGSVALSLTPRRLRDYTNWYVEWAMAVPMAVSLVWLARYYFAAPEHHNLRFLFGAPLYFLYWQVGLLLVKQMIVAWRTPMPRTQLAEHLEVREQMRKYYLQMCDWHRAAAVAGIVFWPFVVKAGPAGIQPLLSKWLTGWLVVMVIGTVLIEIKRKQLVKVSLRAQPVRLPDLMGQSEMAKWPVCYQPSAPMLMLKGAHGYSLNLANSLARLSAAYLAGFVALVLLLRMTQ